MARIRRAAEGDIPALVGMGRAMHDESPHYASLAFSEAKVEQLIRWMLSASETQCALVAEESGRIVGMLGGFVSEYFFGHDLVASDYVFYVRPENRGGSSAVRLLRAFEKWAISAGASEIVPGVSTRLSVARTEGLYLALGYEKAGVILSKRIK